MLPSFHIFGYDIAMYGLLNLIGIVVAIFVALLISRISELEKEDVVFSAFYGVIGVVAGGKILYLLINAKKLWDARAWYIENPEAIIGILSGGFVFYGGILGGVLLIYLYCRRYNVSIEKMFFTLIPVMPLIHAFGRVGCFCAGCCYGVSYHGLGHVVFSKSLVAPNQIELFPVQLVESGCNVFIFLILLLLVHQRKSAVEIAGVYGLLYSILRFSLEFLRGDVERGFFMKLSTSQWMSLVFFILSLLVLWKKTSKMGTKK